MAYNKSGREEEEAIKDEGKDNKDKQSETIDEEGVSI